MLAPAAGEETADGRHQARPVGAAQQEPAHILGRQPAATRPRVLVLHLVQGVTPDRLRSANPYE